MKKLLIISALMVLSFAFSKNVFANETFPQVQFEITSGVDLTKEAESTFDSSRTIAGTAETGAIVSVAVSHRNRDGELENLSNHNTFVGSTKIFSQKINLVLGENVIEIVAGKERRTTVVNVLSINRKEREIKLKLEQDIIIPGNSILRNG